MILYTKLPKLVPIIVDYSSLILLGHAVGPVKIYSNAIEQVVNFFININNSDKLREHLNQLIRNSKLAETLYQDDSLIENIKFTIIDGSCLLSFKYLEFYIWIRESDKLKCMIIDYDSTNGYNKKIDTIVL